MVLEINEKDSMFCLKWQVNSQGFSTDWIPDTPSNRKSVLVFLRLLRNDKGKRLFTFQELSMLFKSNNRQASSQHIEDFRDCGSDFLDFLTRKRKVDSDVVDAVTKELCQDPLAKLDEIQQRVNARLSREDLTVANIRVALEQIPYTQIRDSINNQLDKGKLHYQEEYLLSEMMRSLSGCHKAGIEIPESQGMTISDPTSIRKLITPDTSLSSLKDSLKKKIFQTRDKRTVKRRLSKLKESSESFGIQEWVEQTESNLPKLLPSVGSVRIPTTTNAIERFFRAFNRFYKVRCGFFSVLSAKRELIFFLLMYLFIRQSESGKSPIETIMPEVVRMPLYKLINDPFGTVLGLENVKKNVKMADFKPYEYLEA